MKSIRSNLTNFFFALKSMRILIVDDDAETRLAMGSLLQQEGHQSCQASTGEEALRMLETENVELVLLDLDLGPGIDGWDVARHKHKSDRAAKIPFIVISGSNPNEAVEPGERNPLSDALMFMSKPVDASILFHYINTLKTIKQA